MATKLKNLKVTKVDFVDEGANPDAHTRLTKKKDDGQTGDTGKPGGKEESTKGTGVWKRLLSFIGKAAGMDQEEIDSAVEEIRKGDSESFGEKINEVRNRKIADEIWDTCCALQSALCSILNDEDLDSTGVSAAMQESLDEFHAVMQENIGQWSEGRVSGIVRKDADMTEYDLEVMKSAAERLNRTIEKASAGTEVPETGKEKKGDKEEMEIDKSRMTPSERAFYEDLAKRYGTGTEGNPAPEAPEAGEAGTQSTDDAVAKGAPAPAPEAQETGDKETGDIYKGLHPAVKAELESLKKFREEAEDKEMYEVAKRYEIIGKKADELAPVLKSLKAAGGTAYNDMIAVLDQTVEAVEKSGAFSEIGKSGHDGDGNSAEAKIGAIAKSYMEQDASLSRSQAVAKAWEDYPDLLAEYDEQAGF